MASSKRKKLFLVDAMAMAYKSFYGLGQQFRRADGFPTSAIYGCALSMTKLIKDEKPDYLTVVTDTRDKNFRHEMFPDYKAHRDEMPSDLVQQIPIVMELFEAFAGKVCQLSGYEADDLIGTMAKNLACKDLDVFIVSGDKDFLQLVDDHIFLYTMKKNEPSIISDADAVMEKFGCAPDRVVDLLGLMGDKADNVPGVPGVGEKTAIKLIKEFGSIEGLYENIATMKVSKQKEKLIAHQDEALLSRQLVRLKLDVPFTYQLEEMDRQSRSTISYESLRELYERFEFRQLAKNLTAPAAAPIPPKISSKTEQPVELHKSQHVENDQFDHLEFKNCRRLGRDELIALKDSTRLGIALNTKGIDHITEPVKELAVVTEAGERFFISMSFTNCVALKSVFLDSHKTLIGHGLKRPLQLLLNAGIDVKCQLFDTKICDYLLNPNTAMHDLEHTVNRNLAAKMDINRKDNEPPTAEGLVQSAELSFQMAVRLEKRLKKLGLMKVYCDIEIPLLPVLARMERNGVYIDADFLADFSSELGKRIAELEKSIFALAGEDFNLNSPKQLQEILFTKLEIHKELGVSKIKRTKTGYSTDESVLDRLSAHPIAKKLLEYRSVYKLKSTYVDALPQHINAVTGRLHTSLHQTVTATGRLSSNNPNLQNIPMRTELGRRIRKAFVPEKKDDVLISADYSQVEIRILAHMAQAQSLIESFKKGLDIHRVTAAKVFEVPEADVDGEMRSRAKAVNFGIIYGMGAQRLAAETGVSLVDAKDFIRKYFEVYPEIRRYTEYLVEQAEQFKISKTLTGRLRPILGLQDRNRGIQVRARNMAINSPIQGTAADLIKLAMINIDRWLIDEGLKTRMLLQIHDELLFSAPKSELEYVMRKIKEHMESVLASEVPLLVDINYGKNWLEAH